MPVKPIAFLFLLLVAKASAFSFGKCPQVTASADANFNVTQVRRKSRLA